MAIINFSHKFVFVHVPKAAGTSVSHFLSRYTKYRDLEIGGTVYEKKIGDYYLRFGLGKHATAQEIRSTMGGETWSEMFSFAFVRHPVARAHSTFRFLKFHHREWHGSSVMDEFATFEEFLRSDFFATCGPDRIFNPQCFWLGSGQDFNVDLIGRLETLDADMERVVSRIGSRPEILNVGRENASSPADPAEVTATALEIIGKRYEEDFRRLEYEASDLRVIQARA
jgi:hypothetical protein